MRLLIRNGATKRRYNSIGETKMRDDIASLFEVAHEYALPAPIHVGNKAVRP